MTYRYALILVLLISFGVSCDVDPCGSTPEAFVHRADDFFDQANEADYPASDDAWQVYDERFQELVEVCYPQHEEALTREQDRQFWADVSSYYVRRYGRAGAREALRKLRGGVTDQLDKIEGWLDRNL